MATPDVLVVGGGIVGAAVARALAADGVSVEVVDSGAEPGAATPASAGMLAPLAEAREDDPLLGLGVRGRDRYYELAPALAEETGVDIGLWRDGVLALAATEDEEDRARRRVAWQRQQGLNVEWLSAGELRERCPGIAHDVRGALLAPEDGVLDPLAALEAFLVSATRRGARLVRGERVLSIELDQDRVTGVRTATGFRPAGAVVIAAGCWSGRLGGLPRPLSVEPVRGQMLALEWPQGEPGAVVFTGHGYVLRRGPEALVGSTMEFAGFEVETTGPGTAQLAETAACVYPALRGAPVHRSWAGLRPMAPDGRPIIGRDDGVPNLWYATGHGRNGILLAAVTGEIIAYLFKEEAGEQPDVDLSPVRPSRFWRF
jgi:glycine oxidase